MDFIKDSVKERIPKSLYILENRVIFFGLLFFCVLNYKEINLIFFAVIFVIPEIIHDPFTRLYMEKNMKNMKKYSFFLYNVSHNYIVFLVVVMFLYFLDCLFLELLAIPFHYCLDRGFRNNFMNDLIG